MKKFKEDIDKQYIEKMFSHNIEPSLKDIIEKLSNLDIGFFWRGLTTENNRKDNNLHIK